MKHQFKIILVLLSVAVLFLAVNNADAADKLKYEDYQIQLKGYQDRESAAKTEIDGLKKRIGELDASIKDIQARISALWNDIYAFLGVTPEQYAEFMAYVAELEKRTDEIQALPPAKRLERAADIDTLIVEVERAMTQPVAKFSEPRSRLERLAGRLQSLKNSLPQPQNDMYSVVRGDYLWKIAGKPDIYKNPMQWPRIWSANRKDINDPDLIYPGQKFRIPRQIGRDQHLIVRGEYLAKIAGYANVYGDPFQWTKLYQANKSGQHLQDPNVIYPEMILDIPRN